ncbi:MAG: OmpA family protein [Bacteroidota bacterium]
MRSLSAYLIFFWLTTPLFGQIAFWQKYLGGKGYDQGKELIYRPDGTLIIGSEVWSTDGFGDRNHSDGSDIVLCKYATQGKIFWKSTLGGSGNETLNDLITTKDGGFLMVGSSTSQDGDVPLNYGGTDVWVVKLNGMGRIEWSVTFGGTGDDQGTSVIETEEGDFLVGGESGSVNGAMRSLHHGGLDSWLAFLRKDGSLIFEQHYGGKGNEKVCSVHQSGPNRYLITNTSDSGADDIPYAMGAKDVWVFSINEVGEMLWQGNYGGSGNDDIHDSYQDSEGNLVFAGTTFSDDGHIIRQQGLGDLWMFKIDKIGLLQWSQTLGGPRADGGNSISPTLDGGYVVGGLTKSRSGEGDIQFNEGYYDGFLLKLDSVGDITWARTIGNAGKDVLNKVIEVPSGGYISVGYSIQGANGVPLPGHHGVGDIWLTNFGDPDRVIRPFVTPPIMIGTVRDKDTGRPIEATITLTDNKTLDSLSMAISSPEDGSFVLLMPAYGMVSINVLAKGYMFFGQDIRMDSVISQTSIRKDFQLEAIRIGSSLILENVFFNTGRWNLLTPSKPELERIVAFMDLNPRVLILVSGHTDNTGNKSQKVQLSLNRANAVRRYLVKRGIPENRMRVKGYGMYRPIAPNSSKAGRKKNRRVEFEVLNM